MNWEDILKVQVISSKQKVKMGNIPIPTEDDTDCNRKLKEFADKLRNYNILLKERWEAGWPNKEIQELFGGEIKVNHPDMNSWRLVDKSKEGDNPASSRVIYLGWSNWEDMTTKNINGEYVVRLTGSRDNHIYNISGYYESRKFGNNWHK